MSTLNQEQSNFIIIVIITIIPIYLFIKSTAPYISMSTPKSVSNVSIG
jgi:hypothetical protein